MPRRLEIAPHWTWLVQTQDSVVTVAQAAECGFTRGAIGRRVEARRWQRILPGVLLLHDQPPTRRQRLLAASLWAGTEAAIDGASACWWHGIRVPGFDAETVHLVVPYHSPCRTTGWVKVRRSQWIRAAASERLVRYVDVATAVVVAARGLGGEPAILSLLARPVQQRLVTVHDLVAAHMHAPPRGRCQVGAALVDLAGGVHSPAERDAKRIWQRSRILPPALWNCWLRLPDGGPLVSPDALVPGAAMIVEVNGRRYHAWGQDFEATEARQARLVATGFAVSPATPLGMRADPQAVLRGWEATFLLHDGRGMPPGVQLLRLAADGSMIIADSAA